MMEMMDIIAGLFLIIFNGFSGHWALESRRILWGMQYTEKDELIARWVFVGGGIIFLISGVVKTWLQITHHGN
jgi:hypothetical protein